MLHTDKADFAALMSRTWRFYDRRIDGETVADWYDLLLAFPMDAIRRAFMQHLADPKSGQYLPKPADIFRYLGAHADDRPGPDEAWGMLVRVMADERETGVLTEEMRHGWEACGPIFAIGDEVGARKCFLEAYARAVQDARAQGRPVRWTVSLGADPTLRTQRLEQAVAAGRITHDHALRLLPGPTPITLDQVAGLLEGPDAPQPDHDTAARLRALAAMLRASATEDADRRSAEARARREQELAEKARLWELSQPPRQEDAA